MAAIEHKLRLRGLRLRVAGLAILFAFTMSLRADQPADALATVNYVATALSDDNAADAMTIFDKSFGAYDKLHGYFLGLTDRAYLMNELSVTEEEDTPGESKLTVLWIISITDRTDKASTEQRQGELHIRLLQQKGKWKIADLSPIDLFDPRPGKPSK